MNVEKIHVRIDDVGCKGMISVSFFLSLVSLTNMTLTCAAMLCYFVNKYGLDNPKSVSKVRKFKGRSASSLNRLARS